MIRQIQIAMRPQTAVSKEELKALLAVGSSAKDQREFSIAFNEARRTLEQEGIFFRAPHAGSELYTRCIGDEGAETVQRQLSRRAKAARKALQRALARAQAAAESALTKDARRLAALKSASDRLQMQEAHVELFVRKRNFE